MVKVECPKCGNTSFLVCMDTVLFIDETNMGSIKYRWINKIVCANIECSHVLEDDDLIKPLLNKTHMIFKAMSQEPLLIE